MPPSRQSCFDICPSRCPFGRVVEIEYTAVPIDSRLAAEWIPLMKPHAISGCAALAVVLSVAPCLRAEHLKLVGKLRYEENLEGVADAVALSPDQTRVAVGYNVRVGAGAGISAGAGQGGTFKGRVLVWDVATKRILHDVDCGGAVRHLAFGPDGSYLAAVHLDGGGRERLRILDAGTGKERCSAAIDSGEKDLFVTAFTTAPDGKSVVLGVGDASGAALVSYDPATGKRVKVLRAGEGFVGRVTFSADGRLMSAVTEGLVAVWGAADGKERNSFAVTRGQSAVLSPDGKTVAVSTTGSRKYGGRVALTLHDARTGKELIDFNNLRAGSELAFARDGKYLIHGHGSTGVLVVYDPKSGKQLELADGPSFGCLAVGAKGTLLATGNRGGSVWLWEVSDR